MFSSARRSSRRFGGVRCGGRGLGKPQPAPQPSGPLGTKSNCLDLEVQTEGAGEVPYVFGVAGHDKIASDRRADGNGRVDYVRGIGSGASRTS